MEITIKLAKGFEEYIPENQENGFCLNFDDAVPIRTVLKQLSIPGETPKLILVNGQIRNQEQFLAHGDTLSLFPKMAGG